MKNKQVSAGKSTIDNAYEGHLLSHDNNFFLSAESQTAIHNFRYLEMTLRRMVHIAASRFCRCSRTEEEVFYRCQVWI